MHKISNNERINRSWESREIEQRNSVSSVILHVKSCDFAVITINQRRLTNKHTLRDDKFYKWYQKISGNDILHHYITLTWSLSLLELSLCLSSQCARRAFICQSFLINISIIIEVHDNDARFFFSIQFILLACRRKSIRYQILYIYNFSFSSPFLSSLHPLSKMFRKRNAESCFYNIK